MMAENTLAVKVTTGSADWAPATLKLYHVAFAKDPILTYFVNNVSDPEKRLLNLQRLMTALLHAGTVNNGIFFYGQQGDYADGSGKTAEAGCRGVLLKTPRGLDSISTMLKSALTSSSLKLGQATHTVPLLKKMLSEFQDQTHAAKKQVMKKGDKYYYMYWLATDERERGKGTFAESKSRVSFFG